MKLIVLTKPNGETFHLNAGKIVTVHAVPQGSVIHHEPYNRDNQLDWVVVTETPDRIAYRCEEPAAAPPGVVL